jgi:hypothetical protein
MFRIKQSAIAQALQEGDAHTFTAYQSDNGYFTLTLDGNATLATERGKVREFRKLDALASLVKELGVDQFSVSLKPCDGQPKPALANTKK